MIFLEASKLIFGLIISFIVPIPETMETFVQNIRQSIQRRSDEVIFVLGNESCDLDSAVSALVSHLCFKTIANALIQFFLTDEMKLRN
jgi:hypothetical protein